LDATSNCDFSAVTEMRSFGSVHEATTLLAVDDWQETENDSGCFEASCVEVWLLHLERQFAEANFEREIRNRCEQSQLVSPFRPATWRGTSMEEEAAS
jgi:hypothetical protein